MSDRALELTRHAEASHFWFHGFRAYVTPALDALSAGRRDLRLLDCGCGTGHNLTLLQRYGRAYGFDLTGTALHGRDGGAAPAVRADITRIPFTSGSIDIATSFDVMQCLEPDVAAVREMARVLRPGGAVVLTVAALDLLHGDHSVSWREVRRYTPASARRLVEAAGLTVERVSFMFASLFPLMLAVRSTQRLLRPWREHRDDTDIAVPAAPVNALLTAMVTTEARLARHLPMPVGSSLLVVGRKKV